MSIRADVKRIDREAQYRRELDRNAAYLAALAVVQALDPHPLYNTPCRVNGRRCWTLDEAVRELEQCGVTEARRAA